MKEAAEIDDKIAQVRDLLKAKFGVRRRDLTRMLKKTGRRIPARCHADAQVLLEARKQAEIPKLARQVDLVKVAAAHDRLVTHLDAIDVMERRKTWMLNLAGTLAFNILLVAAGFVFWLWWSGHV